MKTFVGIDPGLHGAIAIALRPYYGEVERWAYDLPTIKVGNHYEIDLLALRYILRRELKDRIPSDVLFYIEDVHTMPGEGCVSSFSFGRTFGSILGLIVGMYGPYGVVARVSPIAWKKKMLSVDTKRKQDSIDECARRFGPGFCREWLPLKKHHGRADALLLAEYGIEQWTSQIYSGK